MYEPGAEDRLMAAFRQLGIPTSEFQVDVNGYRKYFEAAGYVEKYPAYYAFNLPEKSLEHYIASNLLQLTNTDVYIDIASEHSPVPEIYHQLFGATTFRQDLAYEAGLTEDRIGGDAAAMPVPDGFATKMALHCSFEHFEADADMRFIREIGRVLKPGGAVCFVPFYVAEHYAAVTDPEVSAEADVKFEEDATVYGARGWNNRFGRFYDPAHVSKRLCTHLGSLQPEIYRVRGAQDVDSTCYVRFALVLRAPAQR
jgi:SAM-dependent methyltransferase